MGVQECGPDQIWGSCTCRGLDAGGRDARPPPDSDEPTAPPDRFTSDQAMIPEVAILDAGDVSSVDLACGSGLTRCAGSCRDLATDPANCGACEWACGSGQDCVAGMCRTTCAPGQTVCIGVCIVLGTSCRVGGGACLRTGTTVRGAGATPVCGATAGLPNPEICDGVDNDCDGLLDEGSCRINGSCYVHGHLHPANACQRCRADSLEVNGPTAWSESPAGASCESPARGVCAGPTCACRAGQTLCSGACRNLDTDPMHCGLRGLACATGQGCLAGHCANPTGPCPEGMTPIPQGLRTP